jgi:CO/xanthine dehydrogenase FAD-binding subunit
VVSPGQTRIVAFGPTDKAMRCREAEQMLNGATLEESSILEVATRAMDEVSEQADVYSDEAAHRLRLVRPMVERALRQALQRTGEAA